MHDITSSGSRIRGPRQSQTQMFALEMEFVEARESLSFAGAAGEAGEAAGEAAGAGVEMGQDSLSGPTPPLDVVPAEFVL